MAQRDLTIKLAPDTSLRFQFDATDRLDDYAARLARFDANAGDMRPAFDEFGKYMLRSIGRTFAAEGRPARWRALKEATIRERLRLGYGRGPILERTGKLKNSFSYTAKTKYFGVTSSAKYFGPHQYGSSKRNIPKRVMVQLLAQDKAQFTKIYKRHLEVDS